MRRPHVLLVGMQFPPARGSGVYRVRAWANQLVARGFDVTVLAADRDYWNDLTSGLDEALAATIDPRVRIVEMALPHEHLVQDIGKMSWAHANFPKAFTMAHTAIRDHVFPEPYAVFAPAIIKAALGVHLKHKVDLILSSGNPYVQQAAALAVSRMIRRPLVVDYHDPWTLDLWKEQDAYPPGHAAFRWEKRIIDASVLTITVNQPLVDWYRDRYPEAADRIRLVENGLAPEIVTEPGFTPNDGRPLQFGFLGTIRGDLPLEEFLEAWRIARRNPLMSDATMNWYGHLGFFKWNAAPIASRIESGQADGHVYHGPISQTEVPQALSGMSAMAMLLTSSRYVTAGKGFDYMASGRPVAGVFDPRNDTTTLFQNYPLYAGTATMHPHDIADALLATAAKARSQTREQYEACRAEAMRHTWEAAMSPLVDEFERIVR